MKKEKEKIDLISIVGLLIIIMISVTVSGTLITQHKTEKVKLSDLIVNNPREDVGYSPYQLCTAQVNSKVFICENSYYKSIYNMTQEQLDKMIKDCPDGLFINDKICIGDILYIDRLNIGD